MPTREERKTRYKELPPDIQKLYDSELSETLVEEMREKYQISDEKNSAFLHTTGDVILGFRKLSELPFLLQTEVGLSQEAARQLTADLIDAWEPIVLREESEQQTKKESLTDLANKIAAIKPQDPNAPTPSPEAPEPTPPPSSGLADVKPLRTMEADIDDKIPVHGYGALPQNQADDEPIVKATPLDELRQQP